MATYDSLDDRSQAAARASWERQIAERADALNLTERLQAAGRPWPEADADGNVVLRDVQPPTAGA